MAQARESDVILTKVHELPQGIPDRGRSSELRQRHFQFIQPAGGPFADELGGDMQVLGRAPVDLGGRREASQ